MFDLLKYYLSYFLASPKVRINYKCSQTRNDRAKIITDKWSCWGCVLSKYLDLITYEKLWNENIIAMCLCSAYFKP